MTEHVERDDWTELELLDACRDAWANEMHVAMPGRIERYDAAAQVADVQPMLKRALHTESGELVHEELPVLPAVPVVWPRCGDWFLHFPLAPGDFVLLVFCERDPSQWRQTGQIAETPDIRLHHLAHAMAIPGVFPRSSALPSADVPSDALRIGKVGSTTIQVKEDEIKLGTNAEDAVALAPPSNDRMNALSAAFDAFVNAVPTANDGGAALQTAVKVAWPAGGTAPVDVSAAVVKAE